MKKSDLLKRYLNTLGLKSENDIIHKFDIYYELLIDWNNKINLTTITEYEDVVIKHFIDSLMICNFADITNKRVIDVGTGAGFPGLPIKILYPDCNVVLLDSLNKRIRFLEEVVSELNLEKIELIHGRAEDLAHDKKFRSSFDIVVSRAVSNLSTLSEYCIPFLKKDGFFISYKSSKSDDEINGADKAIKMLGSKIENIYESVLPETDISRKFVIIRKCKETDSKYPRKAGIPAKDPL